MKTFKTFFEDNELAIREPLDIGSTKPSFTDLLQWLIKNKANIQSILDLGAFDLGTSRSFNTIEDEPDMTAASKHAAVDFHEALMKFVNRDEKGRGPQHFLPRVYDTDEFKQQHNYDEYVKLDKEWRKAFKAKVDARRANDEEGLAAASAEMSRLGDIKHNSEYSRARQAQSEKENQRVKDMHMIPLSDKELADDGSAEYKAAEAAYNAPEFSIEVYMVLVKRQSKAWKSARSDA